ncbi:hypothetical protein L211DRAFT_363427 [Terfezia boudieri ATCC MYA-4762]|uniref:Uncharacterized protein n=1 Tax=Terfezia boudieri ATCC MYA-4762 TaxID=1051890 RepID=A0A3N4LZF4_9PEZI|nr:hypothetical protein L211DRAFT_363427 [Terfezia boudieri ATCC MYA-4762]
METSKNPWLTLTPLSCKSGPTRLQVGNLSLIPTETRQYRYILIPAKTVPMYVCMRSHVCRYVL